MTDTIGRGAAEAFDEVYRRNLRRVYLVAYMRLGNAADAEDAVQNVFLRYLRSPKTFESEKHEKAYFIRAARNESGNALVSPWRSRRTDFEDLPERGTEDAYPDDTVQRAPCDPREIPGGAISLLLRGVHRPGDRRTAAPEREHRPYPAADRPAEAETDSERGNGGIK